MSNPRYVPEFRIKINGESIPAALRASVTGVSYQGGLEGADRVELSLANENLRWLDHRLLALDNSLELHLGYAPDPLEQMFVGEIVSQDATFPSAGMPTMTVAAQDRLHRLQQGNKTRWFAIPIPMVGNFPIPDYPGVVNVVGLENGLIPIVDPVGAALSVLIGGISVVSAGGDPGSMQHLIRKQDGESDFNFLRRIAAEYGWEMFIEHSGPLGGYQLRFMSSLDKLAADVTLKYGQSLIDFTPRISKVGQIIGVSVRLWQPDIKMEFTVTVSWDWDRQSLNLSISPGFGMATGTGSSQASITLVDEPVTLASAPRIILTKLIPKLNQRLTGSGSVIGDPRIRAGGVLRLEGLGEQFGGLYRVTSVTHTLDSSGYRTSFEVRKEIWFGSIPLPAQGAVPVRLQGQRLG
jgi:hypothetical protein